MRGEKEVEGVLPLRRREGKKGGGQFIGGGGGKGRGFFWEGTNASEIASMESIVLHLLAFGRRVPVV